MVGDHIVPAPRPVGEGGILALGKKELGIGHPAVALETDDEPAVIGLSRVLHIVQDVGDDRPTVRPLPVCRGMRRVVAIIFTYLSKSPFYFLITV